MIVVSKLNFDVFKGLGQPDKSICGIEDIHFAVSNALTLYTGQARRSDNNQLLCVTSELSSASDPALVSPYDITEEIENCTPAWAEILCGTDWRKLDIVNKAQLDLQRRKNIRACSFYGLDRDGAVKQFVEFSFPPQGDTVRIWFDQDAVPTSLDNNILFPDHLSPLIVYAAQNEVITTMMVKMAEQIEAEEMVKMMNVRMNAMRDKFGYNIQQIAKWEREFRLWKNRTRGAQSKRHLKRRSNKGLYG